jgi:cobalamin biosynthesis protein CobD/CbiB
MPDRKKRNKGWKFYAAAFVAAPLLVSCSSSQFDALLDHAALLRPAAEALALAADTRDALKAAHTKLQQGDVEGARDVLKVYVNAHKDDAEVKALLALVESQLEKLKDKLPLLDK